MDHDFYILSVRSSPYMTVKETGKAYGRSTAAIYQDLKEIGSQLKELDKIKELYEALKGVFAS